MYTTKKGTTALEMSYRRDDRAHIWEYGFSMGGFPARARWQFDAVDEKRTKFNWYYSVPLELKDMWGKGNMKNGILEIKRQMEEMYWQETGDDGGDEDELWSTA